MDVNNLQVNTNIVGGYFSAEQIDLLSIIQCKDNNELIDFALNLANISMISSFVKSDASLPNSISNGSVFLNIAYRLVSAITLLLKYSPIKLSFCSWLYISFVTPYGYIITIQI